MPSKHEVIDLFLHKKQLNKLTQGKSAQLSQAELHDAVTKEPNVELHVLQKHVTKVINAHKNKKGVRFPQNAIIGGKINCND